MISHHLEDVEGCAGGVTFFVEGHVEAQDAGAVFGSLHLPQHALTRDCAILVIGALDGVKQHGHRFVRRRPIGSELTIFLFIGFPEFESNGVYTRKEFNVCLGKIFC